MDPTQPEAAQSAIEEGRVVWRLRGEPPLSAEARLGNNTIRLLAEADTGGGITVWVEAQAPFELEIETEFTTFLEMIPSGRTRYLLTYLDRTDVRQL
jgi:hypothetical protein